MIKDPIAARICQGRVLPSNVSLSGSEANDLLQIHVWPHVEDSKATCHQVFLTEELMGCKSIVEMDRVNEKNYSSMPW